jgi:hypothetical protein
MNLLNMLGASCHIEPLPLYILTFNIKSILVATIFLTTGNEALCIAMHMVVASRGLLFTKAGLVYA